MRTIFQAVGWSAVFAVIWGGASASAQKTPEPAALSTQTASISGTVVSSDGTPLSAFLVVNSTTPTSTPSLTTTTGSGGSFQLSKIPAGTYQVCVTVLSGAYVDPCLWNTAIAAIPISASQSLAGKVIQIQKAAVLHVRINDPQNLRNKAQSNGAPRAILIGVFASGGPFVPLVPTSTDDTGFDQEIAIPVGTQVPFTIMPLGLSLTDGSGNTVPATGATVTVSVAPARLSSPTVLTYNVTAGQ